jgi:hypothetical protein
LPACSLRCCPAAGSDPFSAWGSRWSRGWLSAVLLASPTSCGCCSLLASAAEGDAAEEVEGKDFALRRASGRCGVNAAACPGLVVGMHRTVTTLAVRIRPDGCPIDRQTLLISSQRVGGTRSSTRQGGTQQSDGHQRRVPSDFRRRLGLRLYLGMAYAQRRRPACRVGERTRLIWMNGKGRVLDAFLGTRFGRD